MPWSADDTHEMKYEKTINYSVVLSFGMLIVDTRINYFIISGHIVKTLPQNVPSLNVQERRYARFEKSLTKTAKIHPIFVGYFLYIQFWNVGYLVPVVSICMMQR